MNALLGLDSSFILLPSSFGINQQDSRFPAQMVRKALFALALAAALPASASIAVFTDGRAMKIDGFVASEDEMKLTLKGGGVVIVPITRIDRIVDDEIVM